MFRPSESGCLYVLASGYCAGSLSTDPWRLGNLVGSAQMAWLAVKGSLVFSSLLRFGIVQGSFCSVPLFGCSSVL
ncbi:Uncharacterized protein TCM_034971 [Theobroma cacao]|uniref:Uncharacterized protein n=1 Tax=Theobroma cacao TaxID=3641 RepID=A0A061FGR0_THECC|nr:Uncharacterized protein TCM_034971 [Theobroma cacao]